MEAAQRLFCRMCCLENQVSKLQLKGNLPGGQLEDTGAVGEFICLASTMLSENPSHLEILYIGNKESVCLAQSMEAACG